MFGLGGCGVDKTKIGLLSGTGGGEPGRQGSTGGSTINHNLAFFNLTGKAASDQVDVNIITD